MNYRAEIDGLRAIAVLAVILFHANVPFIHGGFVGVDVFFVISGFLITQIIVKGLMAGSFSFVIFYSRRIKRLLPAAFFVLLSTLLVGSLILTPDKYLELGKSAIYTSVFIANFWFAQNSGYFDQSAEISPLVHMWSLAVEEQFYLLTPLLLFLSYKCFKLVGVRLIVLFIFVISLLISVVYSAKEPNYSFYLLHTRAWELSLGSIIVLFPVLMPKHTAFKNMYALTGFVLLFYSMFGFSDALPYPGSSAIIPTLGTALLLASVNSPQIIGFSTLTSSSLMLIGKFSYSAYLWHWPIIVYYRIYISERDFTLLETLVLVLLSLGAGFLSWRYIEEKFRYYKGTTRKVYLFGGGTVGILIFAPLIIYLAEGFPSRTSQEAKAITDSNLMWNWQCADYISPFPDTEESFCVVGEKWTEASQKGIIWGDSHSLHWAPMFHYIAKQRGMAFVVAPLECPAYLNSLYVKEHYPDFPKFTQTCTLKHIMTVSWLNDHPKVDIIVMAASWSGHIRMLYTDSSPENSIVDESRNSRADSFGFPLSEYALRSTLNSLNLTNKMVLLLGDIPRPNRMLNECAFNQMNELLRAKCKQEYKELDAKKIREWHNLSNQVLSTLATEFDNVNFIDPVNSLCNESVCPTYLNDELLYKDSNHLRRNLKESTLHELERKLGINMILQK